MKNLFISLATILTIASFSSCSKDSGGGDTTPPEVKPDAFPGAEGYGRYATGGRGGQVVYVTKLTDDGTPGTLREALKLAGPITILFKVSGNIELKSILVISQSNVTIAGQSAPGDGITIKDYPVFVNADNVIIRFMRFRLGDINALTLEDEGDCITGRYRKNILIDHCSMSWSIDECASFYSNQDFTMQWCIVSESLKNSKHPKGAHGYGGIWGGSNASFHHNLLACNDSRNCRFDGGNRTGTGSSPFGIDKVDYRYNVVYNWGGNSSYGGENGEYNMVKNYYKSGPATPSSRKNRIMEISMEVDVATYGPGFGKFYIDSNYVDGNATVTANNWNGGVDRGSGLSTTNYGLAKQTKAYASETITYQTNEKAYNAVLLYGGASFKRDAVDARITRNVKDKTFDFTGSNGSTNGFIDSQEDVGGWPVLNSTPAPTDSDSDGMPDEWEVSKGLNPNLSTDRNGKTLDSKYTNLEMYLNSLVQSIITEQSK